MSKSASYEPLEQIAKPRTSFKVVVALAGAVIVSLAITLGVLLSQAGTVNYGPVQRFQHAAVASDSQVCSEHGAAIMRDDGGSAVDSAIAVQLCLGIVHPMSSGLGGGSIWLVRDKSGASFALDAREVAPAKLNASMFEGKSSEVGGLAVGVPGELAGMREAWKRWGKVSWAKLFDRAIALSEGGFTVDRALFNALAETPFPAGWAIEKTYKGAKVGDVIKRPELGATMRKLAQNWQDFYCGDIGKQLAATVQGQGGVLEEADLCRYAVRELKVGESMLGGMKIKGVAGAYGGPVVALASNMMDALFPKSSSSFYARDGLALHYAAESFKFAYGDRLAMGDPAYVGEMEGRVLPAMYGAQHAAQLAAKLSPNKVYDTPYYSDLVNVSSWPAPAHGTSHVSIVDSSGMAVSTTTTVNLFFGSLVQDPSSGILLNDEMDDFSLPNRSNAFGFPPSPANYLVPGKRPLSSMSPTVVERPDGSLYAVVGASGGSRIPSGTMQTLFGLLLWGAAPRVAVGRPRMHEQLLPRGVNAESLLEGSLVDDLRARGHKVAVRAPSYNDAVVQLVVVGSDSQLEAVCDWRKQGHPMTPCIAAGY